MRCIVVDDKPLAVDILCDYIQKIPFLELVLSTTNPLMALNLIMDGKADLVFLDIQMPQLNGVQVMKIIHGKCKVILTTAYTAYALDGFEHDAIDYLLKPISFERFYKSVQKAKYYFHLSKNTAPNAVANVENLDIDYLFVKTEYRQVKVNFADILYVEGMQNYVAVYTPNEKIISLQNIKKFEEQLPKKLFMRVHKSYVVALNKIESIERSRIYIRDVIIPVGDLYRDAFFKKIAPKSNDDEA